MNFPIRYVEKAAMDQQAVNIRSDHKVIYLNHMGDDKEIVEDARTSLRSNMVGRSMDRNLSAKDTERISDFIRFRHASTLRGSVLKLGIETTIAMQRQLRTHWVGNKQAWADWEWEENDIFGFNDQSGKFARYKPTFYVPSFEMSRIEVDGFNPMKPEYRQCTPEEYEILKQLMVMEYTNVWNTYQALNNRLYSRELTRMIIPEGMYVAGRMTLNLNAAFGLMSLRIDHPENITTTKPQAEIQQIAEGIEEIVKKLWPAAHQAWNENGRTRP